MASAKNIMSMLGKDFKDEERYLAEFTPPSTYTPPDEARDGREFETMVSAKIKPDGTFCITKLGGIEAEDDGEEIEVDEEEVADEPSMTESMMRGGY